MEENNGRQVNETRLTMGMHPACSLIATTPYYPLWTTLYFMKINFTRGLNKCLGTLNEQINFHQFTLSLGYGLLILYTVQIFLTHTWIDKLSLVN